MYLVADSFEMASYIALQERRTVSSSCKLVTEVRGYLMRGRSPVLASNSRLTLEVSKLRPSHYTPLVGIQSLFTQIIDFRAL